MTRFELETKRKIRDEEEWKSEKSKSKKNQYQANWRLRNLLRNDSISIIDWAKEFIQAKPTQTYDLGPSLIWFDRVSSLIKWIKWTVKFLFSLSTLTLSICETTIKICFSLSLMNNWKTLCSKSIFTFKVSFKLCSSAKTCIRNTLYTLCSMSLLGEKTKYQSSCLTCLSLKYHSFKSTNENLFWETDKITYSDCLQKKTILNQRNSLLVFLLRSPSFKHRFLNMSSLLSRILVDNSPEENWENICLDLVLWSFLRSFLTLRFSKTSRGKSSQRLMTNFYKWDFKSMALRTGRSSRDTGCPLSQYLKLSTDLKISLVEEHYPMRSKVGKNFRKLLLARKKKKGCKKEFCGLETSVWNLWENVLCRLDLSTLSQKSSNEYLKKNRSKWIRE